MGLTTCIFRVYLLHVNRGNRPIEYSASIPAGAVQWPPESDQKYKNPHRPGLAEALELLVF